MTAKQAKRNKLYDRVFAAGVSSSELRASGYQANDLLELAFFLEDLSAFTKGSRLSLQYEMAWKIDELRELAETLETKQP